MKRFLSFTLALLAAAILALAASPRANAAQQVQLSPIDHLDAEQGVVDLTDPADLEAANGEAFIDIDYAKTGLDDGDNRLALTSDKASEGANAPFPRPKAAGNGIEEGEGEDLYRAIERTNTTTSPITVMNSRKTDRSPLMAPNSEYRYLSLGSSHGELSLTNLRTDRLTTVQLL